MIVTIALGLAACQPCFSNAANRAARLDRVSVKGQQFMAGGKPILLQGVNLGGWFVTELWMTPWVQQDAHNPSHKIIDDFTLYQLLQQRFGYKRSQELRNQWRKNWISAQDFQAIHQAGFNFIRLPFRDELLHEPGGMNWLKKAVDFAAKNRIYICLDMHGIPGGQSNDQPTGHANQNKFWTDSASQQKYLADWKLLAKTFAHNRTVAMFDLMNEPMGAPKTEEIFEWQMKALRTIRALDKKTIIALENGYRGWKLAPGPDTSGRTQVCFEPHNYDFNAKSQEDHLSGLPGQTSYWAKLRSKMDAPVYVGEWNVEPFGGPDVIRPYVNALRAKGISWTFWCWKVDPLNGQMGDWGIYRPNPGRSRIDPFQDSFSTIMAKLKRVKSSYFSTSPQLISSFGTRKSGQ